MTDTATAAEPGSGSASGLAPEADPPVRGDLLSCYSTAAAGLLAALGVRQLSAVGGQLFFAVREDQGLTEFLHHHTPLTGDGLLYRLVLERHGAADPDAAGAAIAAEAERVGAVMVTGHTGGLPWLEPDPEQPAPHWFLARPAAGTSTGEGSGEPGGGLIVDDRFTWIDDAGEHLGHTGPVARASVGVLADSPPPPNAEHASRERWALGDDRPRPAWSAQRPWQWWQCPTAEIGQAEPVEWARVVLWRSAAGALTDPAVAAAGWTTGRAAFEALADKFEALLTDPAAYRYHNDLWVASRNRLVFAQALRHAEALGASTAPGGLAELADYVEEAVVPAWDLLVRTMRYNAIRVSRGSRPRPSVITELRRLGALDQQVTGRLATLTGLD